MKKDEKTNKTNKTNKTKGSDTTLENDTWDKEGAGELQIQTQNLLVDKYIKQYYPKSFTEQQNKTEEVFVKNLGENIKYVKQLEGTPYNFTSEGLKYIDREGNNNKISNVLIVPIKKYNYKTEEATKSNIELKAIISPTGEELPIIIESIQDIENAKWYTDPLWWKKIRFELPPQKNKQIDCMKVLSEFMEEETVYKYVGFANEDGKKIFLHTGGAVGTDKAVKVDLENEVLNRYTLTNKKFDIKETLEKHTLKCLEVAPKKITQPIFSLIFTAPLTSTFEEVGIPLGFLTWVQGPPQSMKTSLVAAFVSHFGFFDRNSTPMSFNDKIPSAIQKLGKLKDVVVICDDYFASANKQEAEQMKKFAGELIQLCYDKIIGSRSKSNGEIRKTPRIKGQVIATAEIFPNLNQSRVSRVLIINVKKTDIDDKKLGYIQKHQEELQYTMKEYIAYIISNYEEIKTKILERFEAKKQEAGKDITFRTAEMLAGLYVGYSIFIDFAITNGVITLEEKDIMLQEEWEILLELGKEQNEMVETESPMNMLLAAIEALTNTGKLTTFDYDKAKEVKHQDIMKNGFVRLL